MEMLKSLVRRGAKIDVLSATTFDSEAARGLFYKMSNVTPLSDGLLRTDVEGISHYILKTKSYNSDEMQLIELHHLLDLYKQALTEFQPDSVWTYGGTFFERHLIETAKAKNKKIAFYLVNGNYHGSEWHQSLDAIFTDSLATAQFYRKRDGIHPIPLGTFIDAAKITPKHMKRRHVTFVNPSRAKGGLLVAQLAMALETQRPDIVFEVVEGRSPWIESLLAVSRSMGCERKSLQNVIVTPMTQDMSSIYGRSRIVLAPSVSWESGSRVLAEASLNGIPAIISEIGGSPEMIGAGGITLTLTKALHTAPYKHTLDQAGIEKLVSVIERLYDDSKYYDDLVQRAKKHAAKYHTLEKNADMLYQWFERLHAGHPMRPLGTADMSHPGG